nr:hypothetical protein [uncultured Microbacterium sp.]
MGTHALDVDDEAAVAEPGHGAHDAGDLVDERAHVGVGAHGFGAAQAVEKGRGEGVQRFGVARDDVEVGGDGGVEVAHEQQVGIADDRGQRRAQFVRDAREGVFALAADAHDLGDVLQREQSAAGGAVEQLHDGDVADDGALAAARAEPIQAVGDRVAAQHALDGLIGDVDGRDAVGAIDVLRDAGGEVVAGECGIGVCRGIVQRQGAVLVEIDNADVNARAERADDRRESIGFDGCCALALVRLGQGAHGARARARENIGEHAARCERDRQQQ